MWKFLIKVVLLAAIILGLAHLIPGLDVPNFFDALIFSCIIALFNSFIAPILIIISFPITVMTVGLFALAINVFLFWVASLISYGVYIQTFWGGVLAGVIVTFSSIILNYWLENIRPPRRPPPSNPKK